MKNKDYAFEIIKDISNKYQNAMTDIIEDVKKLTRKVDVEHFNQSTFKKQIKDIIRRRVKNLNMDKEIAKTLMSSVSSNMYEWTKVLSKTVPKEVLMASRREIKNSYIQLLSYARSAESEILNSSNAIAKDIIAEIVAAKSEGVGVLDSIKSVGGIIKDFEFTDSAGRKWNPQSYMEMASRTQTNKVNAEISKNLSSEIDNDLRIIDTQSGACPICYTYSDAVISMNSPASEAEIKLINEDGFVYAGTYDQVTADGFDHPNCRCIMNVYFPTVSVKSDNMDENENSKNYQDRQKQRSMEREIRKWKLEKAGALDKEAEKRAQGKIREWQSKLNEFAKENNLSRMRWREQISFNTTSSGQWEKNWILGKTRSLNGEYLADIGAK